MNDLRKVMTWKSKIAIGLVWVSYVYLLMPVDCGHVMYEAEAEAVVEAE